MSSPFVRPQTQPAEQSTENWLADYRVAESSPELKVITRKAAVPVVDLGPALERPRETLIFLPTEDDRAKLAKTMRGVTGIAWPEVSGLNVDTSKLLTRQGRKAFVWMPPSMARDRLVDSLDGLGYQIGVVLWSREAFDELADDWSKLSDWISVHNDVVEMVKAPEDVDVLPVEEPASAESEPEPAPVVSTQKIQRASQELIAQAAKDELSAEGELKLDDWLRMGLHVSNGKPTPNVSNVSLLFDNMKKGEVWYDDFMKSIMTRDGRDDKAPRRWIDADDIRTTIEVQRKFGVQLATKSIVSDAIIEYSMRNVRNCLRDWILNIVWDGVPRVDTAMNRIFGAQERNYERDVSRNFFKSLVARAIWPGCKVDTMPVFEGGQGIGKSRAIEALGGEYYASMSESPESKDFYVFMAAKWIIEIAEMDSFSKADVKSVKRSISVAVDRYRSPYGRHSEDHKRQCVFAGSTNRDDWNHDATGARRFWPISCKFANVDYATEWREQLFAEACHMLKTHAKRPEWWIFEEPGHVKQEQEKRYLDDDWMLPISEILIGRQAVNPREVYRALDIDEKDWNRATQMRIGEVMRRLGWLSDTKWDSESGSSKRMWVKRPNA